MPLEISDSFWSSLSINFIIDLSISSSFGYILVVLIDLKSGLYFTYAIRLLILKVQHTNPYRQFERSGNWW